MVRAETQAQALARFEESNTLLLADYYQQQHDGQVNTYISDADIDVAIANNTSNNAISGTVFDELRQKIHIVKIFKTKNRPGNGDPHEVQVLRNFSGHELIQAIADHDTMNNAWVTMPYIGPELQDCINVQTRYKNDRGKGMFLTLPEPFLWRALRSVIAALAYLHCGVPPHYRGSLSFPQNWTAAAHGSITAKSIMLDMRVRDDYGYPSRAVLCNFSQAIVKPRSVVIAKWHPAKQDLEDVAKIFHKLAHGRTYRNRQSMAGRWCDCLDDLDNPLEEMEWAAHDEHPPTVGFRNFLELFAWANMDEDVTSADLLAKMNFDQMRNSGVFSRQPTDSYLLLPAFDDALTDSEYSNGALRQAIPALRDVWGEITDPWETMEPVEET